MFPREDSEYLASEEWDTFAYKQCCKLAYYVAKVYHVEILQMKAEFLRDENGNVWFFFAHNVQMRPAKGGAATGLGRFGGGEAREAAK